MAAQQNGGDGGRRWAALWRMAIRTAAEISGGGKTSDVSRWFAAVAFAARGFRLPHCSTLDVLLWAAADVVYPFSHVYCLRFLARCCASRGI